MTESQTSGPQWAKSSYSGGSGDSIEVGKDPVDGSIIVRSTRNPEQVLRFTVREWDEFVEGVKQGEFGSER